MKFNYPEGATPLDDYSGLIPKGIHTQADLNSVEAENIFEAQKKYLQSKVDDPGHWFNVDYLKTIHKAMFGNVWTWAGEFRKSVTTIGVAPYKIAPQLSELCADVQAWTREPVELTFLEQAARVHHRLVFIHPFENGNGRFSRLVADRYLKAYGCPYPHWPSLQDSGESRTVYIKSLKAADQGDYALLVSFMRELGARDPYLSELLGFSSYRKMLTHEKRVAMVHALIKSGCEINETHNNGHSPLQIAIQNHYEEIARILFEHGADMQLRDKSGYDAFELAINKGMFELAKKMYDAGYPYSPRIPTSLKIKYDMRDKFDMMFF